MPTLVLLRPLSTIISTVRLLSLSVLNAAKAFDTLLGADGPSSYPNHDPHYVSGALRCSETPSPVPSPSPSATLLPLYTTTRRTPYSLVIPKFRARSVVKTMVGPVEEDGDPRFVSWTRISPPSPRWRSGGKAVEREKSIWEEAMSGWAL